jgi:isochorismate synthase
LPSPKSKKPAKFLQIAAMQLEADLPFVLYKKPGAAKVMAVLQEDAAVIPALEDHAPGFLLVPFHLADARAVRLRADRQFQTSFQGNRLNKVPARAIKNAVAREIHQELVGRAVEALKRGSLEKVVVARRFSVEAPEDLLSAYFELLRWYPDAFGYFWHHPEIGTWMGATPELLLRFDSGVAETIALAGTRPADPDEALPRWTGKERHEQQVVTDFILREMGALGMQPQTGQVRNVRAGSLWHLGTSIRAATGLSGALELLRALHPSPAVCGLPREAAYDFIRSNENFNREYYCGFLGEVGLEQADTFEFFVNLRCLQFRNGKAFLYVGGGITPDSDPEAEWEETQQKSTTMLSMLKNSG